MTETISILHISDLHRTEGGKPSNDALLFSLSRDRDNYTKNEERKIKEPQLIIVSGDIIQGSATGSRDEVKAQYAEANGFLNSLAQQFLDGEKHRIVLIPGNHDIDWKHSKDSMTKLDTTEIFDDKNRVKSHYLKDAINKDSKIRWSWRDLSFYEIIDDETYNKRIEEFATFYSNFYDGKRAYSTNPTEQFDIFDFPAFKLTIVGYNSCYGNDHCREAGDIHFDCIANSGKRLHDFKKKGRLLLATWHHNTKGLPYEYNYMDSSILKNFIDSGISLGFHGHQHKTEIIHEFSDAFEQKKIVVFSAGTLCASPNELPTGNNRQYNVVEVKWDDTTDNLEVTLHTREKTETSSFDNPIWKPGRIDSNLVSHHTLKIEKPKGEEMESVLIEINDLMKSKHYDDAILGLLKLDINDDFVRKFLVTCCIETENFQLALDSFGEPKTDEEFIVVLNAAINLRNKPKMLEMRGKAKANSASNPAIDELIKRIDSITI